MLFTIVIWGTTSLVAAYLLATGLYARRLMVGEPTYFPRHGKTGVGMWRRDPMAFSPAVYQAFRRPVRALARYAGVIRWQMRGSPAVSTGKIPLGRLR